MPPCQIRTTGRACCACGQRKLLFTPTSSGGSVRATCCPFLSNVTLTCQVVTKVRVVLSGDVKAPQKHMECLPAGRRGWCMSFVGRKRQALSHIKPRSSQVMASKSTNTKPRSTPSTPHGYPSPDSPRRHHSS